MANLFIKCPECGTTHFNKILSKTLFVCPECGFHHKLTSMVRLKYTIDKGSFSEFDRKMRSMDPLGFPGYDDKLKNVIKQTGSYSAVIAGEAKIKGEPVVVMVMDTRFIMASMGSVVGEKIARGFEYATEKKLPVVVFCASGGARMQEGILSLMQMAKTSAAVKRHSDAGLLYISVLTHPTTGGVTASFGTIGDIIIAEKGARIGFAGRRVIEQTIRQKLPADFQTAEYLMKHGQLDMIVKRTELKDTLAKILKLHRH